MGLAEDIDRAMRAIRDTPPRAPVRLVNPNTYRIRQECPLWSGKPSPEHRHVAACDGTNDWLV